MCSGYCVTLVVLGVELNCLMDDDLVAHCELMTDVTDDRWMMI